MIIPRNLVAKQSLDYYGNKLIRRIELVLRSPGPNPFVVGNYFSLENDIDRMWQITNIETVQSIPKVYREVNLDMGYEDFHVYTNTEIIVKAVSYEPIDIPEPLFSFSAEDLRQQIKKLFSLWQSTSTN